MTVTHLLPPYTTTPFDAVMNKVFASFLQPAPVYVACTPKGAESPVRKSSDVPRKANPHHSRSPSLAGSSTPVTPRSVPSPAPSEITRAITKKTWFRDILSQNSGSPDLIDEPVEVPEKPAPTTTFARIWRMAEFTLPPTLQPSMASAWTTCGVVSCPDRPDEIPSMEWTKTMRIKGLGKVDINAYTAYVSPPILQCGGPI